MRCQVRSPATASLRDAGVQAETVGRWEEEAADTRGTGCGSSGHHMVVCGGFDDSFVGFLRG